MDSDEGEEDGGGTNDSDGGYSGRACQLGAGFDSDSNVDMDHVIAVNSSRCFLFFQHSAPTPCQCRALSTTLF